MKHKIFKGILTAAMAFGTVLGTAQYGQTGSITAHAACSHHCRHYSTFSEWTEIDNRFIYNFLTPIQVSTQLQTEYDTCCDCGYKKYYATHCRKVNTVLTPMRGIQSYYRYEYIEVLS